MRRRERSQKRALGWSTPGRVSNSFALTESWVRWQWPSSLVLKHFTGCYDSIAWVGGPRDNEQHQNNESIATPAKHCGGARYMFATVVKLDREHMGTKRKLTRGIDWTAVAGRIRANIAAVWCDGSRGPTSACVVLYERVREAARVAYHIDLIHSVSTSLPLTHAHGMGVCYFIQNILILVSCAYFQEILLSKFGRLTGWMLKLKNVHVIINT